MRASRFSDQIFAFSPRQLIVERVPELWHLSVLELNPVGIFLAFVGLAAVIARRTTLGVLPTVGAAGILFLTLNVGATDVGGFLIPAFVLTWIVVGIGLAWLSDRAAAIARHGAVAAIVAAVVLPSIQLARNYRANDHHLRTYEIRYFDALFDRLEARSALVTESYAVDQLVLYKLAGEHADRGRTIGLITQDVETVRQHAAEGFAVYAFAEGRKALESHGHRFEPIPLSTVGTASTEPIDMPRRKWRRDSKRWLALSRESAWHLLFAFCSPWLLIDDVLPLIVRSSSDRPPVRTSARLARFPRPLDFGTDGC